MGTPALGISAFYHDSAAALVNGDDIVAAAQEERFSRRRHDPSFPAQAIRYCLAEAGTGLADLDTVAFYEEPALKSRRVMSTFAGIAPGAGRRSAESSRSGWPGRPGR